MAGGGLIGKLRVWIGVDNSDYKKGLNQSKQQTSTFAKEVKGNLKSIGTALGVAFGIGALVQFGKKIIQTRGEFQSLEISLTSLLRSKQAANELMREMVDLAARTPFSLQEVATGGKQLIAYGFSAKEVTGTLSQLGNVAAGLGLPMERLTYLYGTTRTQGRLFARDLMQFTTSGIPLLDELAKMFGKSTEEVNKMVSAGSIGFEEVKQAFGNMTGEGGKFYNLMEERSKGISGKISNLGDAIGVMFNNIGKSQEGPINSAIDGAKFLVENYESVWRILKSLIYTYGAYKAALMAVAAAQNAVIMAGQIKAAYDLAKGIKSAKDAMLWLNIVTKLSPLMLLAGAIASVVGAMFLFSEEVKTTEEVVNDLKKATDAFTDTKDNVSALADEYEKLKSKANLSAAENKRLNEIIAILAKTVPTAITKFDQFGKAIDISSEKVRSFNKQAAKAMQLGLALEINRSTQELKQLDKQLKEARLTAEKGIVLKYNAATGRKDAVEKATAEEIVQAQETYKKLAADRLDLSTQLESSNKTHLSLIKDQFGITESEQKVAEKITETTRKRADIISEIKRTQTELNALQGKEAKTETELKNIKALEEQLKDLNDEYKAFTGKELGAKVKVETDKDQLKNAAEGSIAYFENEISKRQLAINLTTNEAERIALKAQNDELERQIKLLKEAGNGLLTIESLQNQIADVEARRKKAGVGSEEFKNLTAELERLKSLLDDIEKPRTIDISIVTADFGKIMDDAMKPIDEAVDRHVAAYGEKMAKMKATIQEFEDVIEGGVESTIIGLAEALGQLATGNDGAAWQEFLNPIADMALQLGSMGVAIGIGIDGIKNSFFGLTGAPAIAAGLALIALGTAAKVAISSIPNKAAGGSPQNPNTFTGGYSYGSGASSKAVPQSAFTSAQPVLVSGTLTARGSELVAVINSQEKYNKR